MLTLVKDDWLTWVESVYVSLANFKCTCIHDLWSVCYGATHSGTLTRRGSLPMATMVSIWKRWPCSALLREALTLWILIFILKVINLAQATEHIAHLHVFGIYGSLQSTVILIWNSEFTAPLTFFVCLNLIDLTKDLSLRPHFVTFATPNVFFLAFLVLHFSHTITLTTF